MTNKITVTLCDVNDTQKQFAYTITPYDNPLAQDWVTALEDDTKRRLKLRHNYCFLGFPNSYRDFDYLCNILNNAIEKINAFNDHWVSVGLDPYVIEERYSKEYVMLPDYTANQENLNKLHTHFERLRGTVWNPSPYTINATPEIVLEIENLNFSCHEFESLIHAQRNAVFQPSEISPSNIIVAHGTRLHDIKDEHRQLVATNAYDKRFGEVYMHWGQIGKRLDEVFNDEEAPDLIIGDNPYDITTAGIQCEAINALQYYCGGFDINWSRDRTRANDLNTARWHFRFYAWLRKNKLDPADPKHMLGFLPIGRVDVLESFGTKDHAQVWDILSKHMRIYSVDLNGYSNVQ